MDRLQSLGGSESIESHADEDCSVLVKVLGCHRAAAANGFVADRLDGRIQRDYDDASTQSDAKEKGLRKILSLIHI